MEPLGDKARALGGCTHKNKDISANGLSLYQLGAQSYEEKILYT